MKSLLLTCALLLAGVAGMATAQTITPPPVPTGTDGTVRSLIPSVIAIWRPTAAANLSFDLNSKNFPPLQYPVRYLAPAQQFNIFSSATTPWTVQLELHTQPDAQGRTLPIDLLSFRVNDGPWIKATGVPQVVMSNVGATPGWMPVKLEFALDLTGEEVGGDYAFDMTFTATVLP